MIDGKENDKLFNELKSEVFLCIFTGLENNNNNEYYSRRQAHD